jgi:hypothetical protein
MAIGLDGVKGSLPIGEVMWGYCRDMSNEASPQTAELYLCRDGGDVKEAPARKRKYE